MAEQLMGIVESFNQLSKVSDHGLLTSFTDSEIWRSITADFFQTLPVLVKSSFSLLSTRPLVCQSYRIYSAKNSCLWSHFPVYFFFFLLIFSLLSPRSLFRVIVIHSIHTLFFPPSLNPTHVQKIKPNLPSSHKRVISNILA